MEGIGHRKVTIGGSGRTIHKFDVYQKTGAEDVDLVHFYHLVSTLPSSAFPTLILLGGTEPGRDTLVL